MNPQQKHIEILDKIHEMIMQLRIKSEKERINEKQLYDVAALVSEAHDACDNLDLSHASQTQDLQNQIKDLQGQVEELKTEIQSTRRLITYCKCDHPKSDTTGFGSPYCLECNNLMAF